MAHPVAFEGAALASALPARPLTSLWLVEWRRSGFLAVGPGHRASRTLTGGESVRHNVGRTHGLVRAHAER